MSTAIHFLEATRQQLRDWSWLKKSLMLIAIITFMTSSFLFLTKPGTDIRIWMAQTVIITQHRDWAWMFVGTEMRDDLVKQLHTFVEENAVEKQLPGMIATTTKRIRSIDELVKVEDISGKLWKGKRMYVYDPKSIRIMTPEKPGEGEKITSMVKRTGAVAGVNAGGFNDPEGLGNGFAALGAIISGGEVIYTDQDGSVPQHIVGFTKDGTLIIGKYNIFELQEMGISEAASFYPRVIANGKPLPINDGSRAPRTAVGQKADGTVIFIVIDGRQTHSVGATLKEVQDLFMEDDVINAGFLDGGASSELVYNGELVTKPSSRYGERRLPSAFLVYDHPENVVANRVWDGIDKIDPGGSYDHPDFLKEQAELKAKQKNNPTPAPTPTPSSTPSANTNKGEPTKPDTGSNAGTNKNGTSTPGTTKPPAGKDTDAKETNGGKATPGDKETAPPKTTPTPSPGTSNNNGADATTPPTGQPSGNNSNTGNSGNSGASTPHPQGTPTPSPATNPTPTPPANNNQVQEPSAKPNTGGTSGTSSDSAGKATPGTSASGSAAPSPTPSTTATGTPVPNKTE
ncbi:phosphodiester glycosidase family protein [Paenibacillus sp. OAS669]|uniref:phosphodiester glycosidase family protein n=1 Tax=Paenibacillus sp. OAS669 TaxID=2663821 RepID=UPI001A0D7DFC|nr:phosphodiester glycosidase family protein [Paenibacillus sp. OAS669]MBE1443486.1 exopolysaccharide biosynthesis protein [Paenibacillus sp. OAS669]